MELKFKTVYENKLVNCYPVNNLAFRGGTIFYNLPTECAANVELCQPSDAPIFLYTGKKDIDGNEIYEGHQLIMPDEKLEKNEDPTIYTVVWEEMVSGFVLENELNQIIHCDGRVNFMRIFGHHGL